MSAILRYLFVQLACLSIVSVNSHQTLSPTINRVIYSTFTLPSGYIHHPSVNAAFKVHSERRNWSNPKQIYISKGGRLAVADIQEKVQYINAQKPRHSSVWIGITEKRGNWVAADTNLYQAYLPRGWGQRRGVGICVAVKRSGTGLCNKLCLWAKPFACEIATAATVYQIPNVWLGVGEIQEPE